jgi:hypothetical protein
MSLNVASVFNFKPASSSHGWTQQELAEFYRVEASLARANIPIETDRGRSDEGDPWFVFCNANTGEIIVHFARSDGTYVVAGPALDSCVRGRDFRALIEAQIAGHPLIIPKSASGGKVFIHPAALLIVLVATYFFKLSQTTAAAAPAHLAVEPLEHSDSKSQAVMLDERATATLLAAIVTGIAWAQAHDYNLWNIVPALQTKVDVSRHHLSVSTSLGVDNPFDAGRDNSCRHDSPAARATLIADIGGEPSSASVGYGSLNSRNDHSAGVQAFSSFDTFTPAASQTLPAASGPLFPAVSQIEIVPTSGSTASPDLPSTVPPIPTADQTDIMQLSDGAQTPMQGQANPAQVQPNLENPSLAYRTSVADFVLREFQAAWGAVPSATQYDAWVARVISDPSLENGGMSQALAGTARFQALYGLTGATIATGAAVTALCEGVLGIAPGPGALLNVGLPVWQVLQTFAQSQQFSNELASVSLADSAKFVVTEIASSLGAYNFSIDPGATNVESLNSTSNVAFLDLGSGANVEISGASTTTGTAVMSSYAVPTAPVSFQFDSGVNGVSINNMGGVAINAPTTETILSTGAANGTTSFDFVQATSGAGQHSVSALTINASTSLTAELFFGDFTSAAALTVSGAAGWVDLLPSGAPTFTTIDASGLTAGGLEINASTALTSFTGGGDGNELLFDGSGISASATAIDGGGGTENVVSAQLVNASNGGIFTNWQIVDITDFGGTPFSLSLLTNDAITGVQFHGADAVAETVLNLAPVATVTVTGSGFTDAGLTVTHSSTTGDGLAVTFHNTDSATALNNLTLTAFTSTGDATISIDSTGAAGSAPFGGYNRIGTLTETDGHLTTVTVTGNNYTYVGYTGGINTDTATSSSTPITSALAKIDASATTGGVTVYAGNTTLDGSGLEVSYNGLMIDGGSGNREALYNGANGGVTLSGNGDSDSIWLGGSGAIGILGTGASDLAFVGSSAYATALTAGGPEVAGAALGDTVTFGAGATAILKIYEGGKWDGATYIGGNPSNGIGETIVVGAVQGFKIDLTGIVGTSGTVQNQQFAIAGAPNLTTAENEAAAALGAAGVAYFSFGGNEYLVAAHATEAGVSLGDAVVQLHAVTFTGLSMSGGVVHVA